MAFVKVFFLVSILVGGFQVIDGATLLLQKGKPKSINFFASTVEFIWIFICLSMIGRLNNYGIDIFSSIAYILYNIVGFVYGIVEVKKITKTNVVIVPNWVAYVGCSFGIFYIIVNFIMLHFIRSL